MWARAVVASVGVSSAFIAGFISKIRADRKGAIASATAATLGIIYVIVSTGHANIALFLSLGHAALRVIQLLRSPNIILDHTKLRKALGHESLEPLRVPEWVYRLGWKFNRINTDFEL